jgi:outer membrane protein
MHSLRGALVVAVLASSAPMTVGAQTMLTLEDAMARARVDTPAARAMAASGAEADARVGQARARFLPRVDVSGSVQRGDQPVFVFGALLSQRRFTAANFAIDSLNHPAHLTHVRTAAAVNQSIYDGGTVRLGVRAAELQRDLVARDQSARTQDLALHAARTFVRVLQLEAAERAANGSVAAAESDLERTSRRRDVGLVTDADVLTIEVHLAEVRQRQIAASGDLVVARLELADAVGLPLDQPIALVKSPMPAPPLEAAALVREAIQARPERQRADVNVRLAENGRARARSAFFPRLGVQAGWEFNGSEWTNQRSGWIVGASVDLNLFNGFSDRARLTEAQQAELRAVADREQIERRIEVEVRTAIAQVNAARARESAGRAALAQAVESQRIIRDRYDAGLATVTDVLRAAESVLDSEARATAAEMDAIQETIALHRAAGRL